MKKIITLMLCFAMLFVVAGCGGKDSEEEVKMEYTIGVSQFADNAVISACKKGFFQALEEEGIIKDENMAIIYQSAKLDINAADKASESLMAQEVNLIYAIGTPMAKSALKATADTDVSTVFAAVSDPHAAEIITGNITGVSDELPVEKQLQMIRAIMPQAHTLGIMYCTTEINSLASLAKYKELAPNYGFEIVESAVATSTDIPLAADNLLLQVDCMTSLADNTVLDSIGTILSKAKDLNVPVFGSEISQVKKGCVAAVGIDYLELGIQTGKMATQILKGEAAAAEMPYKTMNASQLYYNPEVMENFSMTIPDELAEEAMDFHKAEE